MKQRISLGWEKKVFPWLTTAIGVVLMLAQWIVRLNLVSVVAVAYCCILSAVIFIALLAKKKVYAPMVLGYAASMVGIIVYYIIWGADAGFGAFTSGLAGFSTAEHPYFTDAGNFGTRLLGNLLLALPGAVVLWALFLTARNGGKRVKHLHEHFPNRVLLFCKRIKVGVQQVLSKLFQGLWHFHTHQAVIQGACFICTAALCKYLSEMQHRRNSTLPQFVELLQMLQVTVLHCDAEPRRV